MEIKKIDNYVNELSAKFPGVSKQDIKKILSYGWKQVYLVNSYGGDLLIRDSKQWCYFGNLKKSALDHFKYYIKKLCVRIRIMYKRKKIPWDGYYYFALTEDLYLFYLSLKNKKGRPKKRFTFKNVILYEILEECKVSEASHPYIFKIPYVDKVKYKLYLEELITDKAELFITRGPLKFKDIQVTYNDYDVL